MPASLTAIARRLSFIRETEGPNTGYWVGFLQRFCGGVAGDSWCCDAVSVVLDVAYKGKPPVTRTGSCQALLDDCRRKGYVVQAPEIDDLFFYVNAAGHAHHVGVVTNPRPLTGIAGNTSPDGTSGNGDGWYEHPINAAHGVFARLPR